MLRTKTSLRSAFAAEHCYVGLTGATCKHHRECSWIASTHAGAFTPSAPRTHIVGAESGTRFPSRTSFSRLTLLLRPRDAARRPDASSPTRSIAPRRSRSFRSQPVLPGVAEAHLSLASRPPVPEPNHFSEESTSQRLEPPHKFPPEWRVRNRLPSRTSFWLLFLPGIRFSLFTEPDAFPFRSVRCRASAVPSEPSCRAAVVMYHGCGLRYLLSARLPDTTEHARRDSLGLAAAFPTSIRSLTSSGISLLVLLTCRPTLCCT